MPTITLVLTKAFWSTPLPIRRLRQLKSVLSCNCNTTNPISLSRKRKIISSRLVSCRKSALWKSMEQRRTVMTCYRQMLILTIIFSLWLQWRSVVHYFLQANIWRRHTALILLRKSSIKQTDCDFVLKDRRIWSIGSILLGFQNEDFSHFLFFELFWIVFNDFGLA